MEHQLFPENEPQDEEDTEYLNFTFRIIAMASMKDVPKFRAFSEQLVLLPFDKRVSFAFDFYESIDGFPKAEPKSMKSSVEALKLKNLGNDAFRRNEFIEALKFYTRSVATAPAGSPELSFAYGNRSTALFELGRYGACIVDINRALRDNYPEASRQKLYNRKQKCRSKIMEHAGYGNSNQISMQKLSVEDNGCETKKDCPFDEDALDLDYTGKFPLPQTKLQNDRIPNTSEKIEMKVDSTFGRHIVAVKRIEIGEFISVEKAYASVLHKTYQYSHCARCLLRCEALIPCPGCSAVMYCSQRCREDDFNRSHRIECQIHTFSYSLGLPLTTSLMLAVRILMIVTKQGENVEKLMKDPLFKNPMKHIPRQVPEKFDSQDSVHLLSLENRTSLLADDPSTSMVAAWRIYHVLMIGYILRQTTYFDVAMVKKAQKLDQATAEKEKYIGLLFMKLWISIPLYTFGVDELVQGKVGEILMHVAGMKSVAKGFYMFHSLFNHSCFVNATGSFYRDTMVTQAIQPIKAGEQLFVPYVPNFMALPRNLRHEHLRSYQFECRCVACEQDWPPYCDMSTEWLTLSNSKASVQQMLYYKDKIEKFANNPSVVIEFSTDSFKLFCKYLNIFHKNHKIPNRDHAFAFMVFMLILQSRGNNYLYTQDSILMFL